MDIEDGKTSFQEEKEFPPGTRTEPSPDEIKLTEEISDKNQTQFDRMQEPTLSEEKGIEEPEEISDKNQTEFDRMQEPTLSEEKGIEEPEDAQLEINCSQEPEMARITAGTSGSSQLRISGGSATESVEPDGSCRRRWISESQASYFAGEDRGRADLPKKVKQDCLNNDHEHDPLTLEGPSSSSPPNEKLRAMSEPPNQIPGDKEEKRSNGSSVIAKKIKQKKKVVKPVSTAYTTEERERLYGNGRFVIAVDDIGKDIDNHVIWEIEDETRTLRQYYPANYQKQNFFVSMAKRWPFSKKGFKSAGFFERFQPIVVIETPAPEPSQDTQIKTFERIVQFVYIDKLFFRRMTKSMGKIHVTEDLRKTFMDSLPVPILIALNPDLMFRWYRRGLSTETYERFRDAVHAWETIFNRIEEKLADLRDKCGLSGAAWRCLITFPNFQTSTVEVEEVKEMSCSACKQLPRRAPAYIATFPVESSKQQPYNRKTLENVSLDDCPPLEFHLYWCKQCTEKGRKLHRLMHFQHYLLQLKRQNVALDIEKFIATNGRVTDSIILWIHNRDMNWKNKMFLDFQVIMAEADSVSS